MKKLFLCIFLHIRPSKFEFAILFLYAILKNKAGNQHIKQPEI